VGEDREGVFLAEGSHTELPPKLLVGRREAYPVAVQVSVHGRMVHHNALSCRESVDRAHADERARGGPHGMR
jgi:hypothetical protein